jgi:hypothetical protein
VLLRSVLENKLELYFLVQATHPPIHREDESSVCLGERTNCSCKMRCAHAGETQVSCHFTAATQWTWGSVVQRSC